MGSLTFKEAAVLVLEDEDGPHTARELWSKIEERGLVESTAKQPWNVLYNTLSNYSDKKSELDKDKVLFKVIETDPVKFELASKSKIELIAEVVSPDLDWKKIVVKEWNGRIFYDVVDCEEYTYLINDPTNTTIKIGRTINNPEERLSALKTANPDITISHVLPASSYPESELHKRFEDYRKDREWFFATKELESFVEHEKNKAEIIWEAYTLYKKHKQVVSDLMKLL